MSFIKSVSILLIVVIKTCLSKENNLNSYLEHRYEDVKLDLMDSFNIFYRNYQDTNMRISIENLDTFYLPQIPFCFNMRNRTYILMSDQIYTLTVTEDGYIFEPHSVLSGIKDEISFVKVEEHEDTNLMFVEFTNGYFIIYAFKNSQWIFKQSLPKLGLVIDICIFNQDDNLYLFVINYLKNTSVPAILYHWKDSKFEEIDSILTTEATSVTCFKNGNSNIVVINQNPVYDINMVGSYVIEINRGILRKKHFLSSHGDYELISYILNGERYIIELNNKFKSTIYWWDETHFIKWKQIKEPIYYQKMAVYYVQNNPVLFAARENQLIIYNLQTENIKVISEIPYQNYFWKILTIDFANLYNEVIIYIIGLDADNKAQMLFVSINFEVSQINADSTDNEETIVQCLLNLHENLIFRSDLISYMKIESQKILQRDQDEVYRGIISSRQDAVLKNNIIHKNYTYAFYNQYEPVKQKLKNLRNEVNVVNQHLKQLSGNVRITGKLHVENLKVSEVQVNRINNNVWNPEKWLLKSKPQVIYSPIKARNIFAKNVTITDKNNNLNDLLIFDGQQILDGEFTFKNLIAQNIYANKINNIPFEKMCVASSPIKVLGTKNFSSISVKTIHTATLNERTTEDVLHYLQYNIHYNFYNVQTLNVQNFDFDIINGIYWRDFAYSLFNTNNPNEIEGSIIIHSDVKIKNLITKKISNIDVNQILTTSTDQTITSDMQMMNIFAENIITSSINGISFSRDVVTFHDNNFVKGPVTIKSIHVQGDVNGKEFPEPKIEHLIMYDGHVKIDGSLTLTNCSSSPDVILIHKNKYLPPNFLDEYWLKNKEQIIPQEVTALAGISVKKLTTTYINDNSFVLYSSSFDRDEDLSYEFKHVIVNGNLTLHSNKNLENLEKIFKQGVKRSGGQYKIRGQKFFTNTLEIDELNTMVVDNTEVDNLAKINTFNRFKGTKTFEELIVQGDLILPQNYKLRIREINNFLLTDLLNRTIFIDRDSYVNNFIFEKEIETSNLIVKNINGENVDEMAQKILNLYGTDRLDKIFIDGNLNVEYLKATKINDINIREYFSQLVSKHDDITINGNIIFKNDIYIDNLIVDSINGLNLEDLSKQYLTRSQDQEISGHYEFKNVKSLYINAPEINKIRTDSLIDISAEDIHIHSNLEISNLNCDSASSKHFNFDLREAAHNLKNLPGSHWSDVTILKDINIEQAGGNIGKLLSYAVNALKHNTITEKV